MQILKQCWLNENVENEVKTSYEYVLDLQNRIEETCEMARRELNKARGRYKKYYDRKARSRKYKPGDKVLILLPTDNNKLLLQWKGPFPVIESTNPYDYKLDINGKIRTFHANMLKQYFSRAESNNLDNVSGSILQIVVAAVVDDQDSDQDDELVDLNDYAFLSFSDSKSPQNLDDLIICDKLSKNQKDQILHVVSLFKDVFSDNPGNTKLVEHNIELTTDEAVRSKYPLPFSMRDIANNEITKMLELDVIERSESPYASPIVLVRKKDNSNRFCVDYRAVNRVTIFDPEPMPKPIDIYAKLKEARYLTKIDLSKGYWQISVRREDRPKTAFISPDQGCFQFKRMPFGLMNSAATFNRMMRKLLHGMTSVSSYIDDVLIHTSSWKEHLKVLRELLFRLSKAGLTIKVAKCMFGFDKLDYIGHMIGTGTVEMQSDNIDKIRKAKRPTTKRLVRSFNGLASYYRDHIPNFATIIAPLTDLTKKNKPNLVEWNECHEQAYSTLKSLLSSEPVLQMPDFEKRFILQVDASDVGLGSALMQEHDGELLPVAFASKKLLPREKAYSVIEKECLAVVYAVQKFNQYLYGREFTLQTDHLPLICMNRNRVANDRIMRWSLLLQPYQMRIEYIKGSQNVFADFLSRCS
jgi:hypothetical protein